MITASITELFHDLQRGAAVVASTRRLARQVEQRYADWMMGNGATAWPTPSIQVYDDWLQDLWRQKLEHRRGAPCLLSDDQELLLWEQVIRDHPARGSAPALLQIPGTARTARRTWNLLHEWHLDSERLRGAGGADSRAFGDWVEIVRAALRDNDWLTPAQLSQHLVDSESVWLPGRQGPLWWMGFDAPTPAHEQIIALLRRHGVERKHHDNAGVDDADTAVVAAGDAGDQWRRIARWARAELTADPGVSLGVVCPDLHQHRDRVEEVLDDVLHPELSWQVDAPRSFHVSLGRPLDEYPIVGAALDLLRWTSGRVPFDVVSRTLRSPYLGAGDWEARVALELDLRKENQESFTKSRLRSLAAQRPGLEGLGRCLAAAAAIGLPRRADPASWASRFSDWLRAFGWPGERGPDSHEHQALNAWRDQLSRFAGLNAVQSQWTLSEALKKLSAMASARILQFHDDQAPVQVMGASEARGLWFDKLWLADMGDSAWPPPARPDPFIPVAVQKEAGMPGASAQAALEEARRHTANLLASARQVRVSFAAVNRDAPEALSPLFTGYPAIAGSPETVYPGRAVQLLQSAPRPERVEDQRAPPVTGYRLRGGVGLLADQARCPFRALAHHRLGARELPEVAPGMDSRRRGNAVHDAMKHLWDRLHGRDELRAMDGGDLRLLVSKCAAQALQEVFADSPFQRRFLEIERERLEQLMMEWLDIERQRPWFQVAGTEVSMETELAGAGLRIRVDRIDRLGDGRCLIIDYKTGQLPNIREWVEPRMEEPQLPAYALSMAEETAGLVLAGIKRGECALRGISDEEREAGPLKPVRELGFDDLGSLRSWWAAQLEGLVSAYRGGAAQVDPKSPQTCRSCDAEALCRIFERDQNTG